MLGQLFLQKWSKKLFIHLLLGLPADTFFDNLIHSLNEGMPWFQDREVLRSELMILQDEENLFEDPSECEVEEPH